MLKLHTYISKVRYVRSLEDMKHDLANYVIEFDALTLQPTTHIFIGKVVNSAVTLYN